MKKKFISTFLFLIALANFIPQEAIAGGRLDSSTQVGDYRKDVWICDDGRQWVYMIDRNGTVVSVVVIKDGKIINILP